MMIDFCFNIEMFLYTYRSLRSESDLIWENRLTTIGFIGESAAHRLNEEEMTEIESKIEENTDSQYLLVAFTANTFLSGIKCKREFIRH
jgi:hypothetical protein